MKLPSSLRKLTRRSIGVGGAEPISPEALQDLAARAPVVVIGVGVLAAGTIDPRLPGEQRTASLRTLAERIRDLPRQQAIALHCG